MWESDHKESWALKNWCFWTVVLEETVESPLDCKETQPVHPKEISPGCSLEGLMLKLKVQYFGYLMWRVNSWERPWCWERLKAGEEWDREWDRWIQWTWVWVNPGRWWGTRRPGMLQSIGSWRGGHNLATEQEAIPLASLCVLLSTRNHRCFLE